MWSNQNPTKDYLLHKSFLSFFFFKGSVQKLEKILYTFAKVGKETSGNYKASKSVCMLMKRPYQPTSSAFSPLFPFVTESFLSNLEGFTLFEITIMTASNPITESKQAAVLLHMEEKLKVCFLFHLRNQQLSCFPMRAGGPRHTPGSTKYRILHAPA